MKTYEKPIVIANDNLAEGVYAASGSADSGGRTDCYVVTANIHQRPETGRGDYRIQFNARHVADQGDGHHSGGQMLYLTFNQPVEYVSSNGALAGGSGTSRLAIEYAYHNNAGDNVGLGDVIVTSEAGLADPSALLACNGDCGQH